MPVFADVKSKLGLSYPMRTGEDQEVFKEQVLHLVLIKGLRPMRVAERFNVSPTRITQILTDEAGGYRKRLTDARKGVGVEEKIATRIEQLVSVREEAWLAYERSMEDAESISQVEEMQTVYKELDEIDPATGAKKKVPDGRKLQVVKRITKIEGRLPDNAYLRTVTECLREEARLEGLINDVVVNVNNDNRQQNAVFINWDTLVNPPKPGQHVQAALPPPLASDPVEAALAQVAQPDPPPLPPGILEPSEPALPFTQLDVGKVIEVREQPVGQWSEAEAKELDE